MQYKIILSTVKFSCYSRVRTKAILVSHAQACKSPPKTAASSAICKQQTFGN